MNSIVSPSRTRKSSNSARICACTDTSSAETGSSAISSSGCIASARAMPMRWRCPPLNSCGNRPAAPGSSCTKASSSAARARAWLRGTPCATGPSAKMSPTRRRGFSDAKGSWNTIWMRLRYGFQAARDSGRRSVPPNRIAPESACTSRTTQRASVLLPEPLSPTRPRVSPRRSSSVAACTAATVRTPPNRLRER